MRGRPTIDRSLSYHHLPFAICKCMIYNFWWKADPQSLPLIFVSIKLVSFFFWIRWSIMILREKVWYLNIVVCWVQFTLATWVLSQVLLGERARGMPKKLHLHLTPFSYIIIMMRRNTFLLGWRGKCSKSVWKDCNSLKIFNNHPNHYKTSMCQCWPHV